jgi:protein-tyrosine-phosphatase
LRWLASKPKPASVLMVCSGNICRSPFAAALFRKLAGENGIQIRSAGFFGGGRSCPGEAVAAAAHFGLDLTAHRAEVLTPELVRETDLIIVMEAVQQRALAALFARRRDVILLGDLDPEPIETRTVHDPISQSLDVFLDSYARIARCVRQLCTALRK